LLTLNPSGEKHQMPSPAIVDSNRLSAEIDDLGFAPVPQAVCAEDIDPILAALERLQAGKSVRRGKTYAARNLLATVPAVARLAHAACLRGLVEQVLGPTSFPVRGILFDKVTGANWHVGWHQDQVVPVEERRDVPGFTAWTLKRGVPHVRPPARILERMLTLRVHLDDCGASNGALKVIPGSHKNGLLTDEQIQQIVAQTPPHVCEARKSDALVMRPLLLHASSPATEPTRRRVLHLEYAADPLPAGLQWPKWNRP
jgi:ectoine hydroxylase-related dioxygenase (phytanoyl-CoA dioxygenase family)